MHVRGLYCVQLGLLCGLIIFDPLKPFNIGIQMHYHLLRHAIFCKSDILKTQVFVFTVRPIL